MEPPPHWVTGSARDGSAQTLDPGDGYGTGFVIFALRQSGLPASHPAIRRGVDWLKTHQREAAVFTRSPYKDGKHYISHAGRSSRCWRWPSAAN